MVFFLIFAIPILIYLVSASIPRRERQDVPQHSGLKMASIGCLIGIAMLLVLVELLTTGKVPLSNMPLLMILGGALLLAGGSAATALLAHRSGRITLRSGTRAVLQAVCLLILLALLLLPRLFLRTH